MCSVCHTFENTSLAVHVLLWGDSGHVLARVLLGLGEEAWEDPEVCYKNCFVECQEWPFFTYINHGLRKTFWNCASLISFYKFIVHRAT